MPSSDAVSVTQTRLAGDGRTRFQRVRERLVVPVDATSLAIFRIGFGVIVAWDVWRKYDRGLIGLHYVDPDHHFTWWLFDWVRPHHGFGIYIAFAVLAVAALFLAAGLYSRVAATVVCAGLAYWFLLDKLRYLNHHYLAVLLALLLIVVPAQAAWSLDAKRRRDPGRPAVPAWAVWLIRFQVGAPYFFAGIAKLNFDWLVRTEPMRLWLSLNTDFPLVGQFFTDEVVIRLLTWGSTLLDLTVPFLLLHRRTRVPAFGIALLFHFVNARIFTIGIFPWLMIVATTIFFEPDWPRRLADSARRGPAWLRATLLTAFGVGFAIGGFLPKTFALIPAVIGGFGVVVLVFHLTPGGARKIASPASTDERGAPVRQGFAMQRALAVFLAAWVAIQILLPLRHFAIPGNTHWTEEGNRFAWHMLLKHSEAKLAVVVTDSVTREARIEDLERFVTPNQLRGVKSPDLILQLTHIIEDHYRRHRRQDVEVRVGLTKSLNLRPEQLLIDPKLDLTEVPRPYLPPADWIVPLDAFDEAGNDGEADAE